MYTVVSLEILLLCAVGMPVGLGLGLLSATGILTAATSLLSPELFLAQDTAMLQQLIQENQGGKGLFLFLSVFITLSFAFVAAIPAARAAARVSPVVSMAGPVVVGKRKNRSTRKIHCFESYYARLNLKRHRGAHCNYGALLSDEYYCVPCAAGVCFSPKRGGNGTGALGRLLRGQ